MHRSLLSFPAPTATAAAVLALTLLVPLPARAQSKVAISGWLDIGLSKKTGGATTVGTISRSNLALAGSEDLGDGWRATFRLSTRFDLDTGTIESSDSARPFWKDESTVGLAGPLGSLRLGRALTPLWAQSWVYDAWSNFDRIASPHWWQFAPDFLSNPATHDYARLNDGVFYDSPSWNGFSTHLSLGVERPIGELAHATSVSLNYEQGALALMLAWERNSQKDRELFLGAATTFAGVRWMFSANQVDLNREGSTFGPEWTNWAGASEPHARRRSVNLSASLPIGAHSLRAGFGRDFQGSTSGFNYIGSTFRRAGTGFSGASNMVSVGDNYALSKRTSLFADLSTTRWKVTDDQGRRSAVGWAVGITHAF